MRPSIPRPASRAIFSVLIMTAVTACASSPKGEALLRPGPQRLPTLRAQGNLVIATLQGAAVTVQPLTRDDLDAHYVRRPDLVNPFKMLPTGATRPLAFIVRIQNLGRDRINFDPGQAVLVDQKDRRASAMAYDELYGLFSEIEQRARVLQALEETVLTNFLVIPPKIDRAGLVLFPPPAPDAKALLLELGSFYVGSVEQLLLFEFEVHRAP